jgi:hypothetical protein
MHARIIRNKVMRFVTQQSMQKLFVSNGETKSCLRPSNSQSLLLLASPSNNRKPAPPSSSICNRSNAMPSARTQALSLMCQLAPLNLNDRRGLSPPRILLAIDAVSMSNDVTTPAIFLSETTLLVLLGDVAVAPAFSVRRERYEGRVWMSGGRMRFEVAQGSAGGSAEWCFAETWWRSVAGDCGFSCFASDAFAEGLCGNG